MRVLLTGAAGFFGSRAARHLSAHDVLAVDRPGADWSRLSALAPAVRHHELDVSDAEAVRAFVAERRPEVAVHLAWYAVPGKYLTASENMDHLAASLVLSRALVDAGCKRLVTAGTCFEYDTTAGLLSETTATAPRFLYSACKLAMVEVLREACRPTAMSYAHARFFYQYGPWEAPGRIVPEVIGALLRGEEARTTAGEQVRDFLHIDDVASAIQRIAESDLEGPVNVGSGVPVRIRDVVLAAAAAAGRPDLVRLGALPYRAGDPMFVCADATRLKSTGWQPRYELDAGMQDTVAFFRERGSREGMRT